MTKNVKIPAYAREIIRRLEESGHLAYAVGGCVRDTLMGREPHDWDIATDAGTDEVMRIFEKTVPTGARFGTVTVYLPTGSGEVTTFRRDGEYRDGRKPESVAYVSELSEDLKRRDFTVNAMAMDLHGEITDLYGGCEDIQRRLIRCVGEPAERFREDALRMLRAVRFSAQLGFAIEEGTLRAIRELAPMAGRLSAERVRDEIRKTLDSPRPERATAMIEYGLTERFISKNGKKIRFDVLRELPIGETRMAAFAILLRKAGAVEGAAGLLKELRESNRLAKAVEEADTLADGLTGEALTLRLAFSVHSPEAVLFAAAAAGCYDGAARELAERRFVRVSELAVRGNELTALGIRGPKVGETLRELALMATRGEVENEKTALLKVAEARIKNEEG